MAKRWLIVLTGALALTTVGFAAPKQAAKGASLLKQISEAFTELADQAKPATVSIKCIILAAEQEPFSSPFDTFGDDFLRHFFQPHGFPFQQPQPQPQTTGGSGFIISTDGYIVTNNHVIKDAKQVTVTLNDGREYEATIKGSDPRTDLAVLKIEETDLPFLSFGDSDSLKAGEWVLAVGNPFGLEGTITKGIVSAKGRQDLGVALYEDFIQTDAPINPGNSGGPLLNMAGEVIGVNTLIFTRSGGSMGIGLAIPSKMVQPVIDQIMDKGSVKRAYLGIMLQPVDKELSDAVGLGKQEGILISDIVKDSPAALAGLQQGDIILQYNDKPAKNVNKFRNDIAMMQPETPIKLEIFRGTKKQTLTVLLGSQDGSVAVAELVQKLGMALKDLPPEKTAALGYSGVVISRVDEGSPAAKAGLRPSFVITGISLDGHTVIPVKDTTELDAALQKVGDKKHVILIVRHQNYQRYHTLKLQ
jgi:serine protease Do